jgi:hypothetical protein
MLQSGGELWRRLLTAFPDDWTLATTLMRLARLPAGVLERMVIDMLERPEYAAARLSKMFPSR